MIKIADLVKTLSEKEKEENKDLIEECLKREALLEEIRKKTEKGLKAIKDAERGAIGEAVWLVASSKLSKEGWC